MALIPKFNILFSTNFDGLSMVQLTGIYNASTNNSGYGSPNIDSGDVTSTSLIITNLTSSIEYDPITSITASEFYSITSFNIEDIELDGEAAFDNTDIFNDGVYEFVFSVSDGKSTYTYTKRYAVLANLRATFAKAGEEIIEGCSCINKDYIDKYLLAFAYITALEGLCISGDLTEFNSYYAFVENHLSTLECGC